MPEYLAPGVFVEEVSGGTKPIEGVPTSTIGMVGVTERGPVNTPTLVTNFGAYGRIFGAMLDRRVFTGERNALPFAVQGAFDNGAGRIYVNRIVGTNATFGTAALRGNAAVGGASTALSARAAAGSILLAIDDGTNLAAGDSLLIVDGPRSEYVTASDAPVTIGVAVTGRLHADQADAAAVVVQDPPVEDANLSAGVLADMTAGGGLTLEPASLATLSDGDVVRISQSDDPTVTEFVTITADGAADFDEGSLLFDHPQATALVHVVTLADIAAATTVNGATPAGAGLIPLNDSAAMTDGAVVGIGGGSTREFHVVRTAVSTLSIATTPTTAIHSAGAVVIRQVGLMTVHARNEGGWSDRLRVRVRPSPLTETTVAVAAAANDSPITLVTAVGLHPGSIVSIQRDGAEIARHRVIGVDHGESQIDVEGGAAVALLEGDALISQEFALIVEFLDVAGRVDTDEVFANLAIGAEHPRYAPRIVGVFDRSSGEAEQAGLSDLIRLSDLTTDEFGAAVAGAADLRLATPFDGEPQSLDGGEDDLADIDAATYVGEDSDDVDDRTGVHALTGVDDISIVAVPGQSSQHVQNAMINHCERMRYRIAVLDGAPNAKLADIQAQRQLYDSTRGALYYPWLVITDPFGTPNDRLNIPPSGHVCGAFARTDGERGVHKAPANVVVRNILDLRAKITTGEQEILNPRGINVIRDFSNLGRSKRIWGARTISSDAEWRYVPVRRLFLFVEKSIERGTQFAVFEPNDTTLWATIDRTISNFLTTVWSGGALVGATPEEAFFVDVGPNTMTQADIDAGRLIINVGIAPVKPAEFVVFRISQKTAGAPA